MEIAEQRKENEEVVKLETEIGACKNNNEDLKYEKEELQYGLPDLEHIKEKIHENDIKEVNKINSQLKDEDYDDYMERLDIRMTALNVMREMYGKGKEDSKTKLEKIATYTIIRKQKYPYIILRTKNCDLEDAHQEIRIKYRYIKKIYQVNYDAEETYSSPRMIREFGNIEIRKNEQIFKDYSELLFKNYTEQKFLEDLKIFSSTHQNGCRTFVLYRKEYHEFPYYGLWVNQVNYNKSKAKLQRKYPNLVELCQLVGVPNAAKLHLRIKEALEENIRVNYNHIKLLGNFSEDEFLEEVKVIAEIDHHFAFALYPHLPVTKLVESSFNT